MIVSPTQAVDVLIESITVDWVTVKLSTAVLSQPLALVNWQDWDGTLVL